ncbi:MAG TPA: hypothetical protein VK701_05760 [Solirubrobacteraceae bacterium]|nr:hypothetical protein [Solirubrobacteraceae bacterium]
MAPSTQRSSLIRLLLLLVRSGWLRADWLTVSVPAILGGVIAGLAISPAAGLLFALCIGVFAAAGVCMASVWRAANTVRNPPPRNEMPPDVANPVHDLSYSTYRNPLAAAELGAGARLAPTLAGHDVDSTDGSFDRLLAAGLSFRSKRPVELRNERPDRASLQMSVPAPAPLPPANAVWLLPSARYHVKELGPLSAELSSAAVLWSFVCLAAPGQGLINEMSRWASDYHVLGDVMATLRQADPRAIVLMNDWGIHAELVHEARARSIVTFAKVEGGQDFENRDTLRRTLPYRNADHVMCQGPYDKAHVGERGVTVGSCRLEDLIALAETDLKEPARERYVVANYNFSYGTREYAAAGWLASIRRACETAAVELAVSVHPAVTPPAGYATCAFPLAFELERAACFVTRSSTALFDAAALGTPVTYFNPHRERCWKDLAFDTSVPELATESKLSAWLAEHASPPGPGTGVQRGHDWLLDHFLNVSDVLCERRMAELVISATS